jgi:hypothetical protein
MEFIRRTHAAREMKCAPADGRRMRRKKWPTACRASLQATHAGDGLCELSA